MERINVDEMLVMCSSILDEVIEVDEIECIEKNKIFIVKDMIDICRLRLEREGDVII